jgi:hypothetical protein
MNKAHSAFSLDDLKSRFKLKFFFSAQFIIIFVAFVSQLKAFLPFMFCIRPKPEK